MFGGSWAHSLEFGDLSMMSSGMECGIYGWDFFSEIPRARRPRSIEIECIEFCTSSLHQFIIIPGVNYGIIISATYGKYVFTSGSWGSSVRTSKQGSSIIPLRSTAHFA